MPEYLTPGVYVEEVSFRAPSIEGVGTSTTGFAGVTLTGPITIPNTKPRSPELLTSFGDFQNIYGGYDNLSLGGASYPNYMAMAVKAFFDNGGSQLYVSRVFAPNSLTDRGVAAGGIVSNGIPSSGTPTSSNVVAKSRFPGAGGNQNVALNVKAARTQNVSSLPSGSLVASAANISSLAAAVASGDTTINLVAPLPWKPVSKILVDSEVMTVTGMDSTGTKLTITPAASVKHSLGAPVMGQVGSLFKGISANDQQLTITATPPPTTTAAPTTTTSGTTSSTTSTTTSSTTSTTTPTPTTTPPPSAMRPPNGVPAVVQVDSEIFFVTQVDSTGTVVSLDHKATVAHAQGIPVFAPITFFANGNAASFQNGTNSLPTATPAGLYVLTMQVTADTAAGSPAVFDGLGFDPAHPYYLGTVLADTPPRHIDALQNQIAFTIGNNDPNSSLLSASALFANLFPNWGGPTANASQTFTLQNGNDGQVPEAPDYDAALAQFTSVDEIAIVGAPGSGAFPFSQDIINSLITHVSQERAYRVAILETSANQLAGDNEGVRAAIDTSYAALYVPWIYTPNPLASAGSAAAAEIAVPPTGFMAGIWARNDEQNGVAKAPANEVILGCSRLERDINFAEQGILNPLGINCLRYFPNRGFRVWGARTASSDSEFMYLNVRRYLVYLEHSIDNSTQWAVFENNGPALWTRVKEAVDSFLYSEWAAGNLLGDTATQAYFVRCDRTTMTQNDLDNGRMICLIGVALLKPAEFVIFRIGQTTALAQS